jgi:hypothetical protein
LLEVAEGERHGAIVGYRPRQKADVAAGSAIWRESLHRFAQIEMKKSGMVSRGRFARAFQPFSFLVIRDNRFLLHSSSAPIFLCSNLPPFLSSST